MVSLFGKKKKEVRVLDVVEAVKKVPEVPPGPTQEELEAIKERERQEEERKRRKDKWSKVTEEGKIKLWKITLEEMLKQAGFKIKISNDYFRDKIYKKLAQGLLQEEWLLGRAVSYLCTRVCIDSANLLQQKKEGEVYYNLSGPERQEALERWNRYYDIINMMANAKKYKSEYEPNFRNAVSKKLKDKGFRLHYGGESILLVDYIKGKLKEDVLSTPELAELLKK